MRADEDYSQEQQYSRYSANQERRDPSYEERERERERGGGAEREREGEREFRRSRGANSNAAAGYEERPLYGRRGGGGAYTA